MDSFGSDRKLSELGDLADLQDLLQCGDDETPDLFNGEHQLTRTRNLSSDFGSGAASAMLDNGWLENFLDDSSAHETPSSSSSGCVQHHFAGSSSVAAADFGGLDQPEHVTSEHSYSLADGGCVATTTISAAASAGVTTTSGRVGSPLCFDIKMESADIDMDDGLFSLINPDLTLQMTSDSDASTASGIDDLHDVPALTSTGRRRRAVGGAATTFVVRRAQPQPTAAAAGGASVMRSVFSSSSDDEDDLDDVMLSVPVKQEPVDVCGGATEEDGGYATIESVDFFDVTDTLEMPPTPPSSSSCSSDSEAGGLSPRRLSAPSSPVHHHHHHVTPYHTRTSAGAHVQTFQIQSSAGGSHQQCVWTSTSGQQPLFASPIPSSGILVLSEEEKRTLVAEGYPIPTKLPLTKQEEKNLKKIRRKIKNKISAQESRRKKKEYLEHLEKRVEFVSMENMTLRKKLDALESNNRSLASQLQKLQSLASRVTAEMQAATTCITVS